MSKADNTTKPDPVQQFEQRAQEAQRRKAEREVEHEADQPQPADNIVQLKLWPQPLRAAPSAYLRSALFAVIKRGHRRALKKELLASWTNVELRYTGWQLDQADLDVWMQAVHQSRECLGAKIVLNERAFLRSIGRSEGGRNVEWLRSSFDRLQAGGVNLVMGEFEYQGSLVQEFARDEMTGRWVVILNQKLTKLFDTGYTLLQLEERRALKSDLAKWLQGYVSSHKATKRNPHRISLEKVRELSGSQTARLRAFRMNLGKAMEELRKARVVDNWCFISDGAVLQFSRPRNRS